MPSYTLAHAAAVVVAILSFAATAILAAYAGGHGADLGISPQVAAWLGVGAAVLGFVATLLPAIQRSPGKRESNYLRASMGQLPPDLAKRHPVVKPLPSTPAEPPSRILPPPRS